MGGATKRSNEPLQVEASPAKRARKRSSSEPALAKPEAGSGARGSRSAKATRPKPARGKRYEEAEDVEEEEKEVEDGEEEGEGEVDEEEEEEEELENGDVLPQVPAKRVTKKATTSGVGADDHEPELHEPIPRDEAIQKWPARYALQEKRRSITSSSEFDDILQAKAHFKSAKVDGVFYSLGDDAYVKAEDGKPDYIARITEIFQTIEGEPYFCAQWFYRAEDTVIQAAIQIAERKRVFISDVKDDNPLNCIMSKIKIAYVEPDIDLTAKQKGIPECDLYYDMKYTIPFCTFANARPDNLESDSCSTISSERSSNNSICESSSELDGKKSEMHLLDLYSGCGAMSTGLCMGAAKAGVKLVTKWAVDVNRYACQTLGKNHPETKVREMTAGNFLSLIKEWERLCHRFKLIGSDACCEQNPKGDERDEDDIDDEPLGDEVFEVEKLLDVCCGDPNNVKKPGMYFKVRWKGYGPRDDTWEPIDGLGDCEEKLKEFVTKGYQSNILPLPGTVDFICGGPPCQGISGFNRFRNREAPLDDDKNKQLVVFMDIVEYLKPSYVLMENVVDILKFSDGHYGRYAMGRLVSLNYQARIGIMAAGYYGVPQFRNRVFLWGSHPLYCLPQYPFPTHDAVNRAVVPNAFKEIYVIHEKDEQVSLQKDVNLEDATADLPSVVNGDLEDEKIYGTKPKTDFQKYIRMKRSKMIGSVDAVEESGSPKLYDHVPLPLSNDDYLRVCRIPKRKGASFRDLPGVLVDDKNTVYFDPSMEREMLESGKPLVPDYAMSFVGGKSSKPFARLWWDETIPTVVTRAEPHNQKILHPVQDRVLTIRENARLQGFPDCYRLYGPVKERYIQVGNAVAIPVSFALGYCLGKAREKSAVLESAVISLPFHFPSCLVQSSPEVLEVEGSD